MGMRGMTGIALALALVFGGTSVALAASQTALVRGTIESANAHTFTIKTYAGETEHVELNGKTKFASVVRAGRKDIKSGNFVGIGGTGSNTMPTALEVVIFPNSMRGMGEGHYPWSVPAFVVATDRHQTANPPTGGPPVKGTMTNGTVTAAAPPTGGPPVKGTMTNGTVANSSGAASSNMLNITYDNGKHTQIMLPDNVPVVRFVVASHSVMVPGAKAFVVANKADNGLTAGFVAVGKDGLIPPM